VDINYGGQMYHANDSNSIPTAFLVYTISSTATCMTYVCICMLHMRHRTTSQQP